MNPTFAALFVFVNIIICVNSKSQRAKYDRFWKATKRECERENCGHLVPEEAYNCVNECTSKACFADIYGAAFGGPLEDGEVDSERARMFTDCLREEAMAARRKKARRTDEEQEEFDNRPGKRRKHKKNKKGQDSNDEASIQESLSDISN